LFGGSVVEFDDFVLEFEGINEFFDLIQCGGGLTDKDEFVRERELSFEYAEGFDEGGVIFAGLEVRDEEDELIGELELLSCLLQLVVWYLSKG
jgi:hypothetical protein